MGRPGCSGNYQVVGASRSVLPAYPYKELGVGCRDLCVVVDYRDDFRDVVDEPLTGCPAAAIGQMDSDEKFGDGNGCDSNFVLIGNEVFERGTCAVGVNEKRGIEQESAQGRLSISRSRRAEATSLANPGSRP